MDNWTQYGFVEKHLVREIGKYGKHRPPVVYAIKGTDPSIIIQTKRKLSRLYQKKKLNMTSLQLLELVPEISGEIITKYGHNPSLREVQNLVRRYNVRGSNVGFLVSEIFFSIKSSRKSGGGG